MSAQRQFTATSERYEGQWLTVARVKCKKCGVMGVLKIGKATGVLPPLVIEKKLNQKGWTVGHNESHDLCPGCTNSIKEKKPAMLKVVQNSAAVSPSCEPPRQIDREDRRIIFAKLNEVYLDGKRGYDAGWSDHRVSTELGVPRKWVEELRVENFGDAGTNSEMTEFYEQAKACIDEARKTLLEAREHHEKARLLMEALPHQKALAAISDRLGKLEKLADSVRKYVVVQ